MMPSSSTQNPSFLSHYTSLSGFVGILNTKALWASNVSFLNDKSELDHGLKAAKLAAQTTKKLNDGQYASELVRVVKDLSSGKIPKTYAVCFCEDLDSLSQWRAYSKGVQGVCVTFDFSDLKKFVRNNEATIVKIIYSDASTVSKMREKLRDVLFDTKDFDDIIGYNSRDVYNSLYKGVSFLLPQFKHYGFRDEKEHRIVLQINNGEEDVCNFRVVENRIVPYIEMKFKDKVPLRSVTVGPGVDQELTKRSVEAFLRHKEYIDIEVNVSTVPFRPSLV